METIIRSEKATDAQQISAMIKRTLNRPDEARLVEILRRSDKILASAVATNNHDSIVVGYALASPMTIETRAGTIIGARITPVLVDRDHQGQGLGSRLIETICQMCDKACLPFIMVMGNPNLYRKFGFEPSLESKIRGTGQMSDGFLLRKGPGFVMPAEVTTVHSCSEFESLDHSLIYPNLIEQFGLLCESCDNIISRMSTLAALLHSNMPYNSWTGFYLYDNNELTVGPFQGPVACLKLAKDTGVCWDAFNKGEPVIVGNVHEFPGHIACDPKSCSEIVLPCKDKSGSVYAVLDIDSHEYNAFNYQDIAGLEQLIQMIQ